MKLSFLTLGLSCAIGLSAAEADKPNATATSTTNTANSSASAEFKDSKERTSYALGVNIASSFKGRGVEVNPETFYKAFTNILSGGKSSMTDAELQDAFKQLNVELRTKAEEKGKMQKAEGEKFLAENAKKEGITKTESGLQYRVIKDGTGPIPKPTDRVSVKYTGKLLDGTVFDSTDKRNGQPATFEVTRVIKGWTEALQKMKVGSTWELFIPSELAYGERGSPNGGIGAHATLNFMVELIGIEPAPPTPAVSLNEPVTSNIIKVPSAEGLKNGEKIEELKPEDVKRLQEEQKKLQQSKQATPPKK